MGREIGGPNLPVYVDANGAVKAGNAPIYSHQTIPVQSVVVTPSLSTGTKIGNIKVNNLSKDLFAPTVSVTPKITSGTEIASIAVGGVETKLYVSEQSSGPSYSDIFPIGFVLISLDADYINSKPFRNVDGGQREIFPGTWWGCIGPGVFLMSAGHPGTGTGDYVAPGLPNITGAVKGNYHCTKDDGTVQSTTKCMRVFRNGTGAFYTDNDNIGETVDPANYFDSTYTAATVGYGNNTTLHIDASKNGTDGIYGKSDTVQPPAIKAFMWWRMA